MIRTLWNPDAEPLTADFRPLVWPYGEDGAMLPDPFDPEANPIIKDARRRGGDVTQQGATFVALFVAQDDAFRQVKMFDSRIEAWLWVLERYALIKSGRVIMVTQEVSQDPKPDRTWRYELRLCGDHFRVYSILRTYRLGRGTDIEQDVWPAPGGHPRRWNHEELPSAIDDITRQTAHFRRWTDEKLADQIDKSRAEGAATIHAADIARHRRMQGQGRTWNEVIQQDIAPVPASAEEES